MENLDLQQLAAKTGPSCYRSRQTKTVLQKISICNI